MTSIKKLFIPYKIALLAKEKGFDKPCLACYAKRATGENYLHIANIGEDELFGLENINMDDKHEMYVCKIDSECSLAPLYQQLVDWFRNEHKIIIHIIRDGGWFITFGHTIENEDEEGAEELENMRFYKDDYYEVYDKVLEEAFKLI